MGQRAGSSGTLQVKDTVWNGEGPRHGEVVIEGFTWMLWDWKEELHCTDELASVLAQPDGGVEKRQCVTKAIAAGIC